MTSDSCSSAGCTCWPDDILQTCHAEKTPIAGVITVPLREIPTQGGPVLHMLRNDHPLFRQFGEVYFSEVDPGCTKGWKRHSRQTQHFAVPSGSLLVHLFDDRISSPTKGISTKVALGRPQNYKLLHIPPGIWYSFTALGPLPALLANCVDIPHTPDEAENLPLDCSLFPV